MGWLGSAKALMSALTNANADRDEEGKFIVMGSITSFMGAGDEYCVPGDAKYMKGGEWHNLAELLNMGGAGVCGVTVI